MAKTMALAQKAPKKLIVAVTTMALFDLRKEDRIFRQHGADAFIRHQEKRRDVPVPFGTAYPLVKKLLEINKYLPDPMIEVCLISRNDPMSALRIAKTLEESGLLIEKRIFTSGEPPYPYLRGLKANLFLSANPADVLAAIEAGFPAATVLHSKVKAGQDTSKEVRIAFDGDCVLFGAEAEESFLKHGRNLDLWNQQEKVRTNLHLSPGPLKHFLEGLYRVQKNMPKDCPIKLTTALVTARRAPADQRPLLTLLSWKLRLDQAFFLAGAPKEMFLADFAPDIFFDDRREKYCVPASKISPAAHVPFGPVG
jgi:5'-nucleotidase